MVIGLLIACGGFSPATAQAAEDIVAVRPQAAAPLFRVFLKDGSSLVSYGEFARVEGRVVFSMPTSVSAENPELHLVDLPAERVDWERTGTYTESARATRYLQTRAESDFALLSAEIAQVLNEIGHVGNPQERLGLVQRSRRKLADWPPAHYNYKRDEVRAMLGMFDEIIAELQASIGVARVDVSLVTVKPAPPLVPLMPPPTAQQLIEQTLAVARSTDVPAERTSLLRVAIAAIDRHASELPLAWVISTRTAASESLKREMEIDRTYQGLSNEIVNLAVARARNADVRGVQRVLELVSRRDAALGGLRPDAINGITAAVENQLEDARRLRLARDRWVLRLPELREYRSSMGWAVTRLSELTPALEDIKDLSGSAPDALGAILRSVAAIQKAAAAVTVPGEMRELHALLLSAVQMADNAARTRREAALTGDMTRAWNASSAAAGALMLTARATSQLQSALRPPQLSR